jgi:[acyl-carrier-protein] S-malonyltransferase
MRKTAFIFPGQGSQYSGMGKELRDMYGVVREVFEEADDALGFTISSVCFEGSDDDLKLTANTQPAILTTSIAILKVVMQETDLKPDYVAGHSLGEFSALVCSGTLSLADAVRTVRSRGFFMQDAVPVGAGAMAAILGVGSDVLEEICQEAAQGEVVAPANFNSPGQIVIAGHADAVRRAIDLAKERGFKKALMLPVSAPSHCALMKPAAERLSEILESVKLAPVKVPYIANADAEPNTDTTRIKPLLVTQLCAPVLWEQSVRKMASLGVERFVEIGPGKVLSGLVKRITKEALVSNVEDIASLKAL